MKVPLVAIGLHQAADIDVALGDHAVERRHYALIVLLLVQHLKLRFLLLDVGLSHRDRRVLCGESQPVGIALLRCDPALIDQRLVTPPRHGGEVAIGLGLLQCCFQLGERRLGLRDLMIKLRRGDLREQLAGLDVIADVDVAARDVAGRARVDIGGRKRARAGRQRDRPSRRAHLHRGDTHTRHELGSFFGGLHHLRMQGEVQPGAVAERASEKQQKHNPKRSSHCKSSTNTPRAGLASLPLRSMANR